jgi:hypothetical protein
MIPTAEGPRARRAKLKDREREKYTLLVGPYNSENFTIAAGHLGHEGSEHAGDLYQHTDDRLDIPVSVNLTASSAA